MYKQIRTTAALLAILCLCPSAAGAKEVAVKLQKDSKGVTITMPQAKGDAPTMLRLEVVADNIIRLRATREAKFPKKESLMIVPQKYGAKFSVAQADGKVTVKAARASAVIDTKTGQVSFFDADGKQKLKSVEGQTTLTPYTVPDADKGVGTLSEAARKGWTWQTEFESPDDEAFYGLGQHQAEEYNYKGKNEELFQYNTKVSVPFVMSNKGYGLLWDSYSLCRWGNPDNYRQLGEIFKLYNSNGEAGKLSATYRNAAKGITITRQEDSIYFEHAHVIGNLPEAFPLNGSKVTYDGFIEAPATDTYHFILYYAGYMRVLIDGEEVVPERWRTAWNPNSWKFNVKVAAHQKVPLRIEWEPDGDVSYCGLRVATPRTDEHQQNLTLWSEMSRDMDYYFISGGTMDGTIAGYRQLTGRAQVMPKWAMGFWQSRERYQSSEDIESTLSEFRRRHIPVDNIVQDWNYWPLDSWGSHEFEKSRYPNPQAMLDSVHAMHGRFMISVWPKFYCTTKNYKELDANGWMYHQAVKDSIYDWLGFMGSFYDAYDAGARKMFWRQMDENLFSKYNEGIDAWWMDASEPNVRDCTPIGYRKALCGPTALGSSTEYFNAYSIVNADAIYNGQRGVNPNKRVFLLTRSGFAGLQRYSTATWSGDIATRWEDLRAQMTAGMNFSMSGIPFWGMDQGGFCVENRYVKAQQIFNETGVENADLKEWRELQTRWNQFGCFVPLYRTHGQWPTREVWNIAPDNHPAYQSIVYYDRLRYRLMPYLYSMAGWVYLKDYTLMRGLVMDFTSDEKVNNIPDQWMFGPSLMACPIGKYEQRSREVYLPKQCGWYDLYTGTHYAGGQTVTMDAPYERIPVMVPDGGIIPFGPAMEWSDEKPAELINLYVYAGRDGEFTLYEDEGTNYNYEKGQYATIDIKYSDATHTLTISDRKGSFDGMLQSRRFNVVLVTPQSHSALNLDNPAGKMVEYSGKAVSVKL